MVKNIRITKINPFSVGKILAAIYFIIGLIYGIGLYLLSLYSPSKIAIFNSFFIILLFPIFYAIIGFIAGVLLSVLYNLLVIYLKGIELQVEDASLVKSKRDQLKSKKTINKKQK